MADSSYHPLGTSKPPSEGATSPSQEQYFEYDPNPTRLLDVASTEGPSGSRKSMSPLRSQAHRKSRNRTFWHGMKTPLEMALLPLTAVAYLAFCYTVHGKVIPVNTYGLYAVTPQHLSTIKGGITAISILIITVALYPISNIVASLKSEEFFRVLASRNQGVPLETINHISTPTFGHAEMIDSVWKKRCTNHYILGMVASLFAIIVTTLAPSALTIETVLSDGDVMAFSIGAVSVQSVINGSYATQPSLNATSLSSTAASIMWAEMGLGAQYSFGVANTTELEYAAYITPTPSNLDTTTVARWLTDVIGINPTCSWATTNLKTTVQIPFNSTSLSGSNDDVLTTAHLVDVGSDVQVRWGDLESTSNFVVVKSLQPEGYVTNHTTQGPTSDGSTIFLLGQCQADGGCVRSSAVNLTLDLSSINTTFTVALTDQIWTMAILVCLPNATIETREVRNNGHGILTVQPRPDAGPLARQGNLNPAQTTALFSFSTMLLAQSAGPVSAYPALGSPVQADVLFGNDQYNTLPGTNAPYGTNATLTPASVDHITQRYTQVLQSSAKPYLAGYLGTAYVPGRITSTKIVFAVAVPNLIISTAVFGLLAGVIIFAHFRPRERIEFTLANIAAAVHGSQLPARFAQAGMGPMTSHTDMDTEGDSEPNEELRLAGSGAASDDKHLVEMSDWLVFMERRADGSPVLHMSRD